MNKRVVIVIICLFLLLVGLAIIVLKFQQRGSIVSPVGSPGEESQPVVELTNWEDPAGFMFSYPETLSLDPHEEDEENYAHLELTAPAKEGKIIIWLKETNYTDIKDYVAAEVGESAAVLDTDLAGASAKKIAYADPQRMVIAAIDVDALLLLEMTPDEEGYWQKVFDQILASFEFVPLEGDEIAPPVAGSDTGGNIIYESEEVIE
jgi:hypothetical protein